jgi:cobalt-zinc-cadmium efflux system outer membrane protein
MIKKLFICLVIISAAGCSNNPSYDRDYVSSGLKKLSNHQLGKEVKPGQFSLPEGVTLEDGLTEDEAVAVALWNNAQFQVDLSELGFARADLADAQMLPNPIFTYLFPVGPKLLETSLAYPIDVFWQRPNRIAAAKLDSRKIAESLIVDGLGLIREVRVAYTELILSQEQTRLAEQEASLQGRLAEVAKKQFEVGQISELEMAAIQVDSLKAADNLKSISKEEKVQRLRFDNLLGLDANNTEYKLITQQIPTSSPISLDELKKTALAARPDLRAAELAIEAAGKRVGWEKSKVFTFIAVLDGKDEDNGSLNLGPALEAEIPILNQNKGPVMLAQAELEQSARQYEAVRQNIILQVRESYTRYTSALEVFGLWNNEIVPSLEKAFQKAQQSRSVGEVSDLYVLEIELKLIEAKKSLLEKAAELKRTQAELNFSVGAKTM